MDSINDALNAAETAAAKKQARQNAKKAIPVEATVQDEQPSAPKAPKVKPASRFKARAQALGRKTMTLAAVAIVAFCSMMATSLLMGLTLPSITRAAVEDANQSRIAKAREAFTAESVRLGEAGEGRMSKWAFDPIVVGIISHDPNTLVTFDQDDETVILHGDLAGKSITVMTADGEQAVKVISANANEVKLELPETLMGTPSCLKNPWIEVANAATPTTR